MSQEGKCGSAYIPWNKLKLDLPRDLQIAFSQVVQRRTEQLGHEMLAAEEIISLFKKTYFVHGNPRLKLVDCTITPSRTRSPQCHASDQIQDTKDLARMFDGSTLADGKEVTLHGRGNGAISSMSATLKTIGINLDVRDYREHAIGKGPGVQAATYIQHKPADSEQTV